MSLAKISTVPPKKVGQTIVPIVSPFQWKVYKPLIINHLNRKQ
uniref:Uncharacterized protein n=1 Tax=Siphoviridae sp. ctXZQ9 TaxID=2825545 RepID=A0A8S5P2T4_9CAUD|nr:MAG TPA: hypothetical protein [Siphoviridae sp. ctXZQ9]